MSNESEIIVYVNATKDDVDCLISLLNKSQVSYTFNSDTMLQYTKTDLSEIKLRHQRKIPLLTYKELFDYALIASSIAIPLIRDWLRERKKKRTKKKKVKMIHVKYKNAAGTVFELKEEEAQLG